MADTPQPTEMAPKAVADSEVLAAVEAASKKAVIDTETKLSGKIGSIEEQVESFEKSISSVNDLINRQFEGARADAATNDEKIQKRIDQLEDSLSKGGSSSRMSAMEIFLSNKSLVQAISKGDFTNYREGKKTKLFEAGWSLHPRQARETSQKTVTLPDYVSKSLTITPTGEFPCGDLALPTPDPRTCIRDLAPSTQVGGMRGFSQYLDICPDYALEGCVAEGAAKPEVDLTGALVTNNACKQAGKVEVTAEQLSFIPGLRTWLEVILRNDVEFNEESNLAAEYIARSTALDVATYITTPGINDTLLNRISAAEAQVNDSGYRATGALISSVDAHILRTSQGADDQYLFMQPGGTCSDDPMCVWRIPYCVSSAVEPGTAIVGDFRNGSLINDFQFMGSFGTTISLGTSGDNRDSNIWTLYAERMSNVDIPCTLAFVNTTPTT